MRSLAAQVRKQFNAQFEMDELTAWGQVGLLEAADRFDPRVGANFLTFAHYRIKGAIFDGLRKMGVLKGGSGRAGQRLPGQPDRSRRSEAGGRSTTTWARSPGPSPGWRWCSPPASRASRVSSSPTISCRADERLELEQMRRRVRAAIEKLPEKERKLLQGYYFQNKTLEEAGAEIGQSKSWASRLHARAVETLKQLLEEDDDNLAERRTETWRDHWQDSRQPRSRSKSSRSRPPSRLTSRAPASSTRR